MISNFVHGINPRINPRSRQIWALLWALLNYGPFTKFVSHTFIKNIIIIDYIYYINKCLIRT